MRYRIKNRRYESLLSIIKLSWLWFQRNRKKKRKKKKKNIVKTMYSRGIKPDGIRKGESNVEALWMEELRWRKWFSDGWIKEPKGMSKCSKDLLGERILCVRFRLCWQKIARINHFPWDPWARGNTFNAILTWKIRIRSQSFHEGRIRSLE